MIASVPKVKVGLAYVRLLVTRPQDCPVDGSYDALPKKRIHKHSRQDLPAVEERIRVFELILFAEVSGLGDNGKDEVKSREPNSPTGEVLQGKEVEFLEVMNLIMQPQNWEKECGTAPEDQETLLIACESASFYAVFNFSAPLERSTAPCPLVVPL